MYIVNTLLERLISQRRNFLKVQVKLIFNWFLEGLMQNSFEYLAVISTDFFNQEKPVRIKNNKISPITCF
jgi:hypothetical protein